MERENPLPPEATKEEYEAIERTLTIFELSAEQINTIKSRIEAAKGIVRVYIHPFFTYDFGDHYKNNPNINRNPQNLPAVILGRNLRLPQERTPLNIVFEVHNKISHTKKDCDEWVNKTRSNNYPLLIPTLDKRATPATPNIPHGKRQQKGWKTLIDKLKDLGVKKIFLSGSYLTFTNKPNPKRNQYLISIKDRDADTEKQLYLYEECVIQAYGHLAESFNIHFSLGTYPHSFRKHLKHGTNNPSDFENF